jgi:hypothetical protein
MMNTRSQSLSSFFPRSWTVALIAGAAALALVARPVAASTCSRWVNQLSPCDGIVAMSVCNNSSAWGTGQWTSYFNWIYSSSAHRACLKFVMKHDPGHEDLIVMSPQNQDTRALVIRVV